MKHCNNELVSVIMPCYNSGKFISQSIRSVLEQTYQNWEMLIIDDCSADTSVSLVKNYIEKDGRIKLFTTQRNSKSPVEPRNIGIKNAKGRYIAFLDSDDIWFPAKLENQVKKFTENNIAIVFSYYEKISEKGKRKNRIIFSPHIVTYKKLLKGDCIGFSTAIYDTEKCGKIYFENIGAEDYVFWLSMLHPDFIALNTKTVEALYRVRGGSLSSKKIKSAKWTWDIYRRTLGFSIFKSIYCFSNYAITAIYKYLK